MIQKDFSKDFIEASVYQITVKGKVDEFYLEMVSNLSVNYFSLKKSTISTMTGELLDQSALIGLLNALFDTRYTVISVIKIDQ